MAATIALISDAGNLDWGPIPCSLIVVTPDTSYPSGGYALTAANCYCGRGITGMVQIGCNTAAIGYFAQWNTQTGKFEIVVSAGFTPAGTVNLASATNASTATPLYVTGGALTQPTGVPTITGATFTGSAVAAAPGTQASGNLSTLTFTMVCFGQR